MKQPPTAPQPSPSASVLQALTDIEIAKADTEPAVAEFLDLVGELIVRHGDPAAVLGRVIEALAHEDVKAVAAANRLTLHRTRAVEQPDRVHVIWTADGNGLAIIPQALPQRAVLTQLRAAISEREEEERQALDFQASVAAGYVEAVEDWASRIADKAGS